MEIFVKECTDSTDHRHSIVKEELIIPEKEIKKEIIDEEIFGIQNNSSLSDYYAEIAIENHGKPNDSLAIRKSERLKNKRVCADDKIPNLTLFVESEYVKNNDKVFEDSIDLTHSIINEKFKRVTTHNIGELAKKIAKAYCKKCRKEIKVVLRKPRCNKCHTTFSYICQTCNNTYSSYNQLGLHLQLKHIEDHLILPCSICSEKFIDDKTLVIHLRSQHNIHQSRQCSKCGKKFSRACSRISHEKFCGKKVNRKREKLNLYKCDKCFYETHHKIRLDYHTLEKHTEGFKAECKNCPRIFKTLRSLRRHEIHYCNKVMNLECDFCGRKFYRKDQIVIHIDQKHMIGYNSGLPLFNCDKCPFKTQYKCSIIGHIWAKRSTCL